MTIAHTVFAVFINLIWGSMFVVATLALTEFPPIFFTGIRFGLLAILLVFFLPVPQRLVWPLLRIGLVMGVGMYLTLYLSLALAENTASIALFSKLEVPFTILLSVLILKERIGFRRIAGVAIALAGAMIISFDPAAFDDLPALFWIGVSSAFSALTMILVRKMGEVHPLTITAWVSLTAAPVMLVTSLLFERNHWDVVLDAGWIGWSALTYTVVMGSIIAHSGIYYLLQRYPVSLVAPFFLLSPVFAVIGGVLFLDDRLTGALVFGGALVLAGVAWINRRTAAKTGYSGQQS